jgi:hypothetical protein
MNNKSEQETFQEEVKRLTLQIADFLDSKKHDLNLVLTSLEIILFSHLRAFEHKKEMKEYVEEVIKKIRIFSKNI